MPFRRNDQRLKYYHARQFGVRGDRRKWTPEDIQRLADVTLTDTDLGKLLDRSVLAIQIKRSRMRRSHSMPNKIESHRARLREGSIEHVIL